MKKIKKQEVIDLLTEMKKSIKPFSKEWKEGYVRKLKAAIKSVENYPEEEIKID